MAERINRATLGRRAQLSLPIFLTRENKYPYAVMATIFAAALYLASNHVHIFEPRYLPMSWLDRAIPFIPETVWIYSSDLILFFATYIFARSLETANKYLYAFLALQIVSCAIFWIWPTTYPRELFPLTVDLDEATRAVFTHLRITDSPANCAPSLHVSSCFLSAFMFRDEDRTKFRIWLVWSILIAFSTLTTKQHYVVDVILGVIFGIGFYWMICKKITYRA